jgi:hypothetical protein
VAAHRVVDAAALPLPGRDLLVSDGVLTAAVCAGHPDDARLVWLLAPRLVVGGGIGGGLGECGTAGPAAHGTAIESSRPLPLDQSVGDCAQLGHVLSAGASADTGVSRAAVI